jgi:hypothetical protein
MPSFVNNDNLKQRVPTVYRTDSEIEEKIYMRKKNQQGQEKIDSFHLQIR